MLVPRRQLSLAAVQGTFSTPARVCVRCRQELLQEMPPWMGGGEMIEAVYLDHSTYAEPPGRFEAGTPAIAQVGGRCWGCLIAWAGRGTVACSNQCGSGQGDTGKNKCRWIRVAQVSPTSGAGEGGG